MDADEYRKHGKVMVDKIADYLTNVGEDHDVLPQNVYPGYLKDILPQEAPLEGEPFEKIAEDIDKVILPGTTHWQSPHMHAFFPALNSYASLLGDMMADAINCLGFTWESSPICTELEIVVMNWLCDALGLPDKFKHDRPKSFGGGVIYTTCSEATLSAMMAARRKVIDEHKAHVCGCRTLADAEILSRLVAYCSDQAHSSVEKASMLCMVKLRHLPTDGVSKSLRGHTLIDAIEEDRAKGLIPFFVCATLGTTGICAFDNVLEIGQVARENGLWTHVDAAYAGTAFFCPEYRHFLYGTETVHSFAFNPSKWMMVHFDCTAFWVDDYRTLESTFCINPVYLMHDNMDKSVDFMHWQIPLSRRFRALKLWFVMRSFGISGLQKHIRHGIELAKYFEELLQTNKIFQVKATRHLGLVVFQLKNNSGLTKKLLSELLATRKLYVVPAVLDGETIIRFTVTSPATTREHIWQDWKLIEETGLKVIAEDYEKCFSGECLLCNKDRRQQRAAHRQQLQQQQQEISVDLDNNPVIKVNGSSTSMDLSDVLIDLDRSKGDRYRNVVPLIDSYGESTLIGDQNSQMVSGMYSEQGGMVGASTGVRKFLTSSGRIEVGGKNTGTPLPELSEEGSHLEGRMGGNCHVSDDEMYPPSDRHDEETSGQNSGYNSDFDVIANEKESRDVMTSRDFSELNNAAIVFDFDVQKVKGQIKGEMCTDEITSSSPKMKVKEAKVDSPSLWNRTGSFMGKLGKRMASMSP